MGNDRTNGPDRLWIYTALAGSSFGLAFKHIPNHKDIGPWLYAKFDPIVDYLVDQLGVDLVTTTSKMLGVRSIPHVTKKIDELEARICKDWRNRWKRLISWAWMWQACYYLGLLSY